MFQTALIFGAKTISKTMCFWSYLRLL